ncbi:aspartic peptidase domain-containing protein [Mycena maculata]|uniref:Aspartic peptidase domain-containing protein n=1 Tax=Mycena maculata TaxID=230809 RepID=A0AAD7I455_9AGAR|nr:aspartic peptidase domain-containing protein [Mycena maculata]
MIVESIRSESALSSTTMRLAILICLTGIALVNAQGDAVSAHPVSSVPAPTATGDDAVSAHPVSSVPAPTNTGDDAVSAHPVSSVPAPSPTEPALSVHPLSFVPAPSSLMADKGKSNGGKIAGGVVAGLAAVIIATALALLFMRMRRRKYTRHWRNRTAGTWRDPEGTVYAGQPLEGYNEDMKVPVASPTTPTAAPLLIREPRIGYPFSGPQLGHDTLDPRVLSRSSLLSVSHNFPAQTSNKRRICQQLHSPPSPMFRFLFSNLLISSVLTRDVDAKPLAPLGRVVPINRSFRHKPPVYTVHSTVPIFYPDPIQGECQGLRKKYFNVSQNLAVSPRIAVLDDIVTADAEAPFIPTEPVVIKPYFLPLTDYNSYNMDLMYFAPHADFGTPPQSLSIDIDSGSADLWIPVNCSECANKQFEDTESTTCKNSGNSFSVSYGSGDVSGMLIQDVVSIAGLKVQNQYFGAVSEVSDDFRGLPNDGLLGMAFGTIAQCGEPTFFENLMENGMLPAPMFSVHLARNQESGSEVCFGCLDNTKTLGPVNWVPVLSKTYWSISMDGIGINGTLMPTNLVAAYSLTFSKIIDTGTTLIYLPDEVACAFYDMIPDSKHAPEYGPEFFTFPCSATLNIQFSFGGRSFVINLLDFNLGSTTPNSPDCVGGILSLGSDGFPDNLAIIVMFVKFVFDITRYTTFDYDGPKVGFSPSVNT